MNAGLLHGVFHPLATKLKAPGGFIVVVDTVSMRKKIRV